MPQSVCFAIPILPGKTDTDRDSLAACGSGDRREAFRASRARHGITREATWIQPTPDGDVAVVLLEADDLGQAFSGLIASDDPFDVWFRSHVADVHGIDLTAGMPMPEQVLDYRR